MKRDATPADAPADVRILLSAPDAARALSISERTLWSLTAPRGSIPALRIGGRVLYRVDALQEWAARAEAEQQQAARPIGFASNGKASEAPR